MGRPLAKRFFGADENNNIKVQFNNGTSSVAGYIVRQKGSKKFLVAAFGNTTTYSCTLVDKDSANIAAGEMTISVKLDNTTVDQVTKISAHTLTVAGNKLPWNFSTSTSDGAVQIEESGNSTVSSSNVTDLEGDGA